MNWVGGARTRVRGPQKSDKKIQKEFFKQKHLRYLYHSEAKRSDSERETSRKHKPVKVSQDVLEFQMQRQLNNQREPFNSGNNHLVQVVNLDGKTQNPRGVNMFGRVNVVELPVSPVERHSVLSLSYTPQQQGSNHFKRVAPLPRKEIPQNMDLFSKDKVQSNQNGCIDLFGKTIKKPISNKRPAAANTREPYIIDSTPATRESYPTATTNDMIDLNHFSNNIYSPHCNGLMEPADSLSEFHIEMGCPKPVSTLNLHQFRDLSADRFEMCNPIALNSGYDFYPEHHSQSRIVNEVSFPSSKHCIDKLLNTGKNTDTFEVSVVDSPESKRRHPTLSKDCLSSYLNDPNVGDSTYQHCSQNPSSGLPQYLQTNNSHVNYTRSCGMSNKFRDFKQVQNCEKEYSNSSRSNCAPCSIDNMKKTSMVRGSMFTWPPRSFDNVVYSDGRVSDRDSKNVENQRYLLPKKITRNSTSFISDSPAKSGVSLPAFSQHSFLVSTGLDSSQQHQTEGNSLHMMTPDSLSANGHGVHVSLGQTGSTLPYQGINQPFPNNNIYKQSSSYKETEKSFSKSIRYSPYVADAYPEPSSQMKQPAKPIKERLHWEKHNSGFKKVTLCSDFTTRHNNEGDRSQTAECTEFLHHPIKRNQSNTDEVLKEMNLLEQYTFGASHQVTGEDEHLTDKEMNLRYDRKTRSVETHQKSISLNSQSCENTVHSVNVPFSKKYIEQLPLASNYQSNEDMSSSKSIIESTFEETGPPVILPTENNSKFTTPKTVKCHKSPPTTADLKVVKSPGQVTNKIKAIDNTLVVIDDISQVIANNGTKVLTETYWQQTVSSNLSGSNSVNDNLESSVQDIEQNSDTAATSSDKWQRGHKKRLMDTTTQTTPRIMTDSGCSTYSPIAGLSSHWCEQDSKNMSTSQVHGRSLNEGYSLRSRSRTD